jgi:monoamine oxidase
MGKEIDYLIVGGGIAGCYTGMKLQEMGRQVVLLEKSPRIGGRLKSVNIEKAIQLEAGAGRFSNRHVRLNNLIKRFNLSGNKVKISSDVVFMPVMNKYTDLPFDNVEDLMRDLVKKAKRLPKSEQIKYTLTSFCDKVYSKKVTQFLVNAFAYYARIHYMNLHDLVRSLEDYIDYKTQFFILAGGLQQLALKCAEVIKNKGGKVFVNREVTDFSFSNESKLFTVNLANRPDILCRNLIIAIPKEFLEKIKYFKRSAELKALVNTVRPYELMRIYAKYPVPKNGKVWFHDIPKKITTDNKLRFIIQIDPSKGTIMIAYPNSDYTHFWNNTKDLDSTLRKYLNMLFPDKKIPKAVWIKPYFWSTGGNTWLPNVDSLKVSKKMLKPVKNTPLYICGESYSRWQAWVEGALETSDKVLEIID